MPLTTEEVTSIQTDLKAGKGIGEIELLKPIGDLVIRTKEGEKAFEEKLSIRIEEEKIKPRISEMYHRMDKEILEHSGIEKISPDEKTYDYNNRVHALSKTKVDGAENTISEMKTQIEAEGADVLRKENTALKLKYDTDILAKEDENKSMRQSVIRQDKTRIFDTEYSELSKTFKTDLPTYFKERKDKVYADIMENSKLADDGKSLILLETNGKNRYGANHEIMSLSTLLKNDFKEVIQEGDGGGGAGGGNPPVKKNENNDGKQDGNGETKPWESLQIPSTIKDAVQLRDWMIAEKYQDTYGDDFNTAFNAVTDKNKLPLVA